MNRTKLKVDYIECAIDFAIQDSEPAAFLTAWREGDWETLRNEWPEFKVPELDTSPDVCADDLITAAIDRICGPAFDLIQKDPHQWSERGCSTCRTITALIQQPFGCVLYSKRKDYASSR